MQHLNATVLIYTGVGHFLCGLTLSNNILTVKSYRLYVLYGLRNPFKIGLFQVVVGYNLAHPLGLITTTHRNEFRLFFCIKSISLNPLQTYTQANSLNCEFISLCYNTVAKLFFKVKYGSFRQFQPPQNLPNKHFISRLYIADTVLVGWRHKK